MAERHAAPSRRAAARSPPTSRCPRQPIQVQKGSLAVASQNTRDLRWTSRTLRRHLPATKSESRYLTSRMHIPKGALSAPALPAPLAPGDGQHLLNSGLSQALGVPRRGGFCIRRGKRGWPSPQRPSTGYPQPALPFAKPGRRASANQGVASLMSLLRSPANLLPNKKMVEGRGGRGIGVKSSP